MDSRGSYVSNIFYVKTKESGPLGARPLDPAIFPFKSVWELVTEGNKAIQNEMCVSKDLYQVENSLSLFLLITSLYQGVYLVPVL